MPAIWSFALALRSRGLGSVWTTLHLAYEREVAELLGIPDNVTQVALLPVAYTIGQDFKPAARPPMRAVGLLEPLRGERAACLRARGFRADGHGRCAAIGRAGGRNDEMTTKLRATPARLRGASETLDLLSIPALPDITITVWLRLRLRHAERGSEQASARVISSTQRDPHHPY